MKLNYLVLGTNNMQASVAFYDALFDQDDVSKVMTTDRMTYWQGPDFTFAVAEPFDQQPATLGNGSMLGFTLNSNEEVSRLYDKALELGGTCEGGLAQRGPYFSAYVRDLDQNKLCFGCMAKEAASSQ